MTEELSLNFITGALKVQLPPMIVARAGWKFDISALVAGYERLQLEKEVRFRFTAGGKKTGEGVLAAHRIKIDYDVTPAQFYHGITISQELTIEHANAALWHELRHAWQSEVWSRTSGKSIDGFNAFYKAMNGDHGASYSDNTFEVDARNYATNRCAEGIWLITTKR